MHLEDVNVQGFKSFSQKTEMSFQPGISVIIGIRTPYGWIIVHEVLFCAGKEKE
jgi:hypothetical protein